VGIGSIIADPDWRCRPVRNDRRSLRLFHSRIAVCDKRPIVMNNQ
jgi:hypothetical protein